MAKKIETYATGKEALEALASELRKLGYEATAARTNAPVESYSLRVAEAPALRSPEYRGDRFVWGERAVKDSAKLAKRIDAFLRTGGVTPSN